MMDYSVTEDIVLKIVVLGDFASRKSGIVFRFITDKYVEELDPTIEDSYHCKKQICYNNETKNITFSLSIVLHTYDPYRCLGEDYTRESSHFAFVYSIDSHHSLDFLDDILIRIARSREIGEEPIFITVIGNNCHLRNSNNVDNHHTNNDKFVTREDGLKFANEIAGKLCQYRCIDEYFDNPIRKQQIDAYISVSFFEVSDKTGSNIEKSFINHYMMKQTFEQFSSNPNVFKISDKNKLLLLCLGFSRLPKNGTKMIPKDISIILYRYLDGVFWNDNQSSSSQCNCCAII